MRTHHGKAIYGRLAAVVALAFGTCVARADYGVVVVGNTRNSVQGWNSYTSTSDVGAAAVHAGLIAPGQTAEISLFEHGPSSGYGGGERNGVMSYEYSGEALRVTPQLVRIISGGSTQAPISVTPSSATIAAGESVTFTASGGSSSRDFIWSGAVWRVGATQTVHFDEPGTYTLTVVRDGALGMAPSSPASVTVTVTPATHAAVPMQVAAGKSHNVALRADGSVWTWGQGGQGQLGTATWASSNVRVRVKGLSRVVTVAAGYDHSLAVRSDGTVWTWGKNDYGQLGDGTTTNRNAPVQIAGLTNVVAVAASEQFSAAVCNDGTVWTWGRNNYGQLGDGTTLQRLTPVQVTGLSGVTSVALGYAHTMALKSDGSVWGWGINSGGRLGDGTTTQRLSPVQVLGISGVTRIAAGDSHTLALKSDGTVWGWGGNGDGQLADGTTIDRPSPVQVNGLTNGVGIAARNNTSMAWKAAGGVWAWGSNGNGQLGLNNWSSAVTTATQIPNAMSIAGATVGERHAVMWRSNGVAFATGYNAQGQLGDGGTSQRNSLKTVSGFHGLAARKPQVASGGNSVIALKQDGTVWSWGYNYHGQLGDGTRESRAAPKQIDGLDDVVAIAAGSQQTVALRSDGTVWAWGFMPVNWYGTVHTRFTPRPQRVQNLANITRLAVGYQHMLALRSDGTVWAWGFNWYGQFGKGDSGTDDSTDVPVQMSSVTDAIDIAAGQRHSAILRSNGAVSTCGANWSGELGDGTWNSSSYPVTVTNLYGVVRLGVGGTHAFKSDGTVWAWGGMTGGGSTVSEPIQIPGLTGAGEISAQNAGIASFADGSVRTWSGSTTPTVVAGLSGIVGVSATPHMAWNAQGQVFGWGGNYHGELGEDARGRMTSLVQVPGLTGVTSIAASYEQSFALKNDGTVWSWGSNGYGELGDGTKIAKTKPAKIPTLSNVTAIAANFRHAAVVKNDGTVWMWGQNNNGQLGDGTTTERLSPVVVPGLTNAVTVAVGSNFSFALRSDGRVWGWGWNGNGQLGNGSTSTEAVTAPVAVWHSSYPVAKVSGGSNHAFAKKVSGGFGGWGTNGEGQIGNGYFENSVSWPWEGLSGYLDIVPVANRSVGIYSNGTVREWGRRWLGGTFEDNYPTPVSVSGPTGISKISAGSYSTFAWAPGGIVWAWGKNGWGQLGDGTLVDRVNPIQATQITDAAQIAAGDKHTLVLKSNGTIWGLGTAAVPSSESAPVPIPIRLTSSTDDTDADGMSDVFEIANFATLARAGMDDLDGDALSDFREFWKGSDPTEQDADGDLLNDYADAYPNDAYNGVAPLLVMLDGDHQTTVAGQFNALPFDVAVWDPSGTQPWINSQVTFSVLQGDGLLATTNVGSPTLTTSLSQLTDQDGTAQGYYKHGAMPYVLSQIRAAAGPSQITFSSQSTVVGDLDGNGLRDSWEIEYFGNTGVNPLLDPDSDGLTNGQESLHGTNPLAADTDGDGINDGQEAAQGRDPLERADGLPLPADVEIVIKLPGNEYKGVKADWSIVPVAAP